VSELHELLDGYARAVHPASDAMDRVLFRVGRRGVIRRVGSASMAIALVAGLTALAGLAVVNQGARTPGAPPAEALPQSQAMALRARLGIEGPTKGAPGAVIVNRPGPGGRTRSHLVRVDTGAEVPLPDGVEDPSISPNGSTVAGLSGGGLVVDRTGDPGAAMLVPRTSGAEGGVSWRRDVLFTRVQGRWVSVDAGAGGRGRTTIHDLDVPRVPGGPMLLSVSPGGDLALLFGLTYSRHEPPRPHLFLGRFDGWSVSQVRPIAVPQGVQDGPMGWLGANAFLLAPAEQEALIVRTDGARVLVHPDPMADPCSLPGAPEPCRSFGPNLLGTNAQGSFLFWQLSGLASSDAEAPPDIVLYWRTWLDGTHGARLSGVQGRYGPALAAR
jgi:hypothetical protein